MNILIVSTGVDFDQFPLEASLVSSCLKINGHNVHCLNLAYYSVPEHEGLISDALAQHKAAVVVVDGDHRSFSRIEQVVNSAIKLYPGIITVIIGPLFTACPIPLFSKLNPKFGIAGDSEETILELVNALGQGERFDRIDGLYFRDEQGEVRTTAPRQPIGSLNTLPLPDYEGFDFERFLEWTGQVGLNAWTDNRSLLEHPRVAEIATSRPCRSSSSDATEITPDRERSIAHLFTEVDHLIARYQVTIINFSGSLFLSHADRIVEFCARIKKYPVSWGMKIDTALISKELILTMKEAGCISIFCDVEYNGKNSILNVHPENLSCIGDVYTSNDVGDISGNNTLIWWWYNNNRFMMNLKNIANYQKEGNTISDNKHNTLTPPPSSNNDFHKELDSSISLISRLPRAPAKLVSLITREEHGRIRGHLDRDVWPLVDATLACPHCSGIVSYSGLSFFQRHPLGCRHCGCRIDLPLFRLVSLVASANQRHSLFDAQELFERGEPLKALETCAPLSGSADGYGLVGTCLLKLGRYSEATPYLEAALQMDPFTGFIANNLGIAYFASGRLGLACLLFKQAGVVQPDMNEARINETAILAHFGQTAIPVLELPDSPRIPRAYDHLSLASPDIKARDRWARQLQTTVSLPDVGSRLAPPPPVISPPDTSALLNNALNHHRAGRLDQAAELYRKILADHPKEASALYFLGLAHFQVGQFPQAHQLISESLVHAPGLAEGHQYLGHVQKALGQINEAIASYNNALKLNPFLEEAQAGLEELFKSHQCGAALPADQALARLPHYPELEEACRLAFARPRRNDLVVVICNRITGRETKIIATLKSQNISVVLICRAVNISAAEMPIIKSSCQEIHSYDTAPEVLEIACRYSPIVYHICGGWDFVIPTYFVRYRPGPIVYDCYDILFGIFRWSHPVATMIPYDRYCLENADGVCCRNMESQAAKKTGDARYKGKRILILDSCWNKSVEERPAKKDPSDIHLVYSGALNCRKYHPHLPFSRMDEVARKLSAQRIHFHIYPAFSAPGEPPFEVKYEEFLEIQEQNPYFHIYPSISYDQLINEIKKYDFGLVNAINLDDKDIFDDARPPSSYGYSTANKIFDYIDAGLPLLMPDCMNFMSFMINRYGGGITFSWKDLDNMWPLLTKRPLDVYHRQLTLLRSRLSLEAQGPRLSRFYEGVAKSCR